MKLNSTQIRNATVVALLAGLSPALVAQTAGQYGIDHNQPAQPVRTDAEAERDARLAREARDDTAQSRLDTQRPGHNSNRSPGSAPGTAGTSSPNVHADSRAGTASTAGALPERPSRPGHNSDSPGNPNTMGNPETHVHGSAASGIVYSQEHVGRQEANGQYHGHSHTHARADSTIAATSAAHQLRKTSANELTGTPVKNRNGESLGRIKDFVIDTNSGQVVYAVVGSGGIAGIGERLYPVPVQALQHDASEGRESMILDVESARWAQAPRLQRDRLAGLEQDQQGGSIHEYYGQTWRGSSQSASLNNPVRTQGSQSAPVRTQDSQQQIERRGEGQRLAMASDLIGKNIRSGNQTVGEVEDVIVQLESGAAAALLDPNDDFAGSDQKYVVPLHRFTLSENNALTTSLRREDFSSARESQSNTWATSRQEGESDSLFVYQGGERQGGSRSDSTRLSTQQQPQRGEAPVAEIRRAIQSDSSLAANQRDIQVETEGNKLVLRGTVLNEDAKNRIEERAERAAPGWDIDNQITVATTGMDE